MNRHARVTPSAGPKEPRGWGSLSKPNGEQNESDPAKSPCDLIAPSTNQAKPARGLPAELAVTSGSRPAAEREPAPLGTVTTSSWTWELLSCWHPTGHPQDVGNCACACQTSPKKVNHWRKKWGCCRHCYFGGSAGKDRMTRSEGRQSGRRHAQMDVLGALCHACPS